ncbi:MAG: hypothetical protein KY460_09170 [Actinobacteria bacterium]|nr:hypothetical protein [Actinomycetota bacterium]
MLLALAAVFAVVNGANDGGAMVAATLRVPGQRAVVSIAALGGALVVVPSLLGIGVASTLTSGLVHAPDDVQAGLIAMGVIAAVFVVAVLTLWGCRRASYSGSSVGSSAPVSGVGCRWFPPVSFGSC